jgi:glutamate-1-semialdehyde 2,1-aminomutase
MYISNSDLLARARRVMPGGSLGSFFLPESYDFVVASGSGPYVRDAAGRKYMDFIMGSGPMILGHAHPAVVSAVQKQLEQGTTYTALNEPSILLAEKVINAAPCADLVKFCSSGSEATYNALRLARSATGRDKILKFEGAYHGHHDVAMMSTTPKKASPFPHPIPDSAGIAKVVESQVLIAPFNDLVATERILAANKGQVAAIIIEPACRLIEPVSGFLEGLRELTTRQNIVLVFDEVVTGFRLAYGGAQALYGVTPDLACYGKILGGGFPLSAIAGRRDLMEQSNPRESTKPDYVYISGTLNGNPVAATAGLATIEQLEKPGVYDSMQAKGDRLRSGLARAAERNGFAAQILGNGPLANIYFTETPIVDYRSAQTENKKLKQRLRDELFKRGFLTSLTAKLYMSTAHSESDIDEFVTATADALEAIRKSPELAA